MDRDNLPEQYLQQAKAAEIHALTAANAVLRTHWRAIANGYRNLAQARLSFFPSEGPLKQSSASR